MDGALVASWVIGITGILSLVFAILKYRRDSAQFGMFFRELRALRESYNGELKGLRDEIESYRAEMKVLRSKTDVQKDRELRLKEQKLALEQEKEARRKTDAAWGKLFEAGRALGFIEDD